MRSLSKSLSFKSKPKTTKGLVLQPSAAETPAAQPLPAEASPAPTPPTNDDDITANVVSPAARTEATDHQLLAAGSSSVNMSSLMDPTAPPALPTGPKSVPCPEGGEASWLPEEQKHLIIEIRIVVAKLYPEPIPPFIELCGDLRLLRFVLDEVPAVCTTTVASVHSALSSLHSVCG